MRVAAARMHGDVRARTAEGRKARGRRGRARARRRVFGSARGRNVSLRPSRGKPSAFSSSCAPPHQILSISRSNVLNARWRRGEISTRPIHARPLVTSTPRRMTHPRLFLLGVGVPADAPLTHGARVKTLTRGKGTSRHTGRAFSSKARALSAYASDDGRPVNDVNDFWRVDDGQNLMGGSTA